MGAANQFRTMGSAFGLAITTSVFNGFTASQLSQLGITDSRIGLAPDQLSLLPLGLQDEIRTVLSEGYNRQMLVLAGLSAAQLPVALLLWRRTQIVTV